MARKKIREYDAKRLLRATFKRLHGIDLPIHVAQVTPATDYPALATAEAFLGTNKLVVKPDMLFGQRGKNDLVGLNLDYPTAVEFIKARMNKVGPQTWHPPPHEQGRPATLPPPPHEQGRPAALPPPPS